MHYILSILIAGLFSNISFGQYYKYNKTIEQLTSKSTSSLFPHDKERFKRDHNVILKIEKNENYQLTSYCLLGDSILSITELKLENSIEDFVILNEKFYFIGAVNTLYEFNPENGALQKAFEGKGNNENGFLHGEFAFRNLEKLNDNLILCYSLYPYHPYDGLSFLQMHLYNIHTKKKEKSLNFPLQGVVFANIIHHWLRVINDHIYIVSPFSAELYKMDFDLTRKIH